MDFHPKHLNNGTDFLNVLLLLSVLFNSQVSFNNPPPILTQLYYNYHPTINQYTNLFAIILKWKVIIFLLWYLAFFAFFTSKYWINNIWRVWTLRYFQNKQFCSGIRLDESNMHEFLYVHIFWGFKNQKWEPLEI